MVKIISSKTDNIAFKANQKTKINWHTWISKNTKFIALPTSDIWFLLQ